MHTPPDLLRLSCGELRAELAPPIGGAIARFYSDTAAGAIHWLRPATTQGLENRDPHEMASFPLVPFCNRLRNGQAAYGALPIDLAPNSYGSSHAMHGVGWRHSWAVEKTTADMACLVYEHEPAGAHDWPYPFMARQRYSLFNEGLTVMIEVCNRSRHAMPVGIGHHPYFMRTPGTTLNTHVSAMWEADADLLPTQLTHPDLLPRLGSALSLDKLALDNNFVGWSREARIEWPASRSGLLMLAESPFDCVALYVPNDADYFCIEPVSNCTDWMNLAAAGVGDVGGTLLPPGETLSGTFHLLPVLRGEP